MRYCSRSDERHSVKLAQVAVLTAVFAIVALTIVPADERLVTGLGQSAEHFLCFAIVGLAVPFAFPASIKKLLSAAVLFALAIELLQIPLPTRHARLTDFLVDALAGCIGIALGQSMMNLFPNKRVNN
jgi:VanZ family protein